ncbi:MAG: hypothetical protein FIB08_08970 [Candidatus Methanoperedens sp.]|nr:hypothetical protein [Candidatus Methanoperedens sp.]
MNLKTVYRLVKVFTFSQVRASGKSSMFDFLRKTSVILLIDIIAFIIALVFGRALSIVLTDPTLAIRVMINLPMFLLFMLMLAGLMLEMSYSTGFMSTDMVNYLPISASEYVLASSLSLVYAYSPFLALGLGGALGIILKFGLFGAWIMTAAMSLFAMFIGALGLEVLKAYTNRVSSILYKRSGKTVLFLRMIVLISSFVAMQLLFNPQVMFFILEKVTGAATVASYIPLLWPSLAITGFTGADLMLASLYAFLTIVFSGVLFLVSVRLRQVYWVPVPVSVKLSTGTYAPKPGILGRLGLNPAESAVIRKDFKSLTRRREMANYLAVPAVMIATMVIPSLFSRNGFSLSRDAMFLAFPLAFGAMFFAYMNSSVSIGQEGPAFWNIQSSPLSPGGFVRAKISANLFISLPLALVFWTGIVFLGHPASRTAIAFLVVLVALVLTESFIGLTVGIMFPDFTETVRNRFISISGALLGMFLGTLAAGVLIAPFGIYFLIKTGNVLHFMLVSVVTLALTALISTVSYRLCISKAGELLKPE